MASFWRDRTSGRLKSPNKPGLSFYRAMREFCLFPLSPGRMYASLNKKSQGSGALAFQRLIQSIKLSRDRCWFRIRTYNDGIGDWRDFIRRHSYALRMFADGFRANGLVNADRTQRKPTGSRKPRGSVVSFCRL